MTAQSLDDVTKRVDEFFDEFMGDAELWLLAVNEFIVGSLLWDETPAAKEALSRSVLSFDNDPWPTPERLLPPRRPVRRPIWTDLRPSEFEPLERELYLAIEDATAAAWRAMEEVYREAAAKYFATHPNAPLASSTDGDE